MILQIFRCGPPVQLVRKKGTGYKWAMSKDARNSVLAGQIYTFLSFLLWGLLPIYWKLLRSVPALEILSNRIIWSAILMSVLVAFRRRRELLLFLSDSSRRTTAIAAVSFCAVALGINWLLYVWAVNSDHVVQASLGYYINPLLSVLLGILFLHERPKRLEIAALVLAAAGVLVLTISFGRIPWVSLGLALSFGSYGLVKKIGSLSASLSLALEMIVLSPVAVVYLAVIGSSGNSHFLSVSPLVTTLLIATGIITAVPLLLFGEGARRVPLSTVGFLQYVAPTLMLLIGTIIYHERFSIADGMSFALIWTALGLYTTSLVRSSRSRRLSGAGDAS